MQARVQFRMLSLAAVCLLLLFELGLAQVNPHCPEFPAPPAYFDGDECHSCSLCDDGGTYKTQECGELTDTVCTPCECTPGFELLNSCDPVHGPECIPCYMCGAGEYIKYNCTLLPGGGAVDSYCSACTDCADAHPSFPTYLAKECSQFSNTECKPCSSCSTNGYSGTYVAEACTPQSDTVCAECETCTAAGMLVDYTYPLCSDETGPLTCKNCSECPEGQFILSECLPGAFDTYCYNCSTFDCIPNYYVSSPCTKTDNSKCSPCKDGCGEGTPPSVSVLRQMTLWLIKRCGGRGVHQPVLRGSAVRRPAVLQLHARVPCRDVDGPPVQPRQRHPVPELQRLCAGGIHGARMLGHGRHGLPYMYRVSGPGARVDSVSLQRDPRHSVSRLHFV